MTPNQYALAALAIMVTWTVGPRLWNISRKLFKPKLAGSGQSLQDAVVQLRYYVALQSPDVRERGQEALDVVEGIVSDQPRLTNQGVVNV